MCQGLCQDWSCKTNKTPSVLPSTQCDEGHNVKEQPEQKMVSYSLTMKYHKTIKRKSHWYVQRYRRISEAWWEGKGGRLWAVCCMIPFTRYAGKGTTILTEIVGGRNSETGRELTRKYWWWKYPLSWLWWWLHDYIHFQNAQSCTPKQNEFY